MILRRFRPGQLAAVAMLATSALLANYSLTGQAVYVAGGPSVLRDHETGHLALTPPAPAQGHPEVIQPDTQIEPSISVNPENPLNAVTVYQEGRVSGGGDLTNGYATTFDGGENWTYGELPKLTYTTGGTTGCGGNPCDRASDAVVAFGPGNIVYANSLAFDDETDPTRSSIVMNVSKDGGATWGDPVFFQDDAFDGLNDKNWIVVDNSDALGHHKGRVYAVWDLVVPVVYNYCDADCDVKANWLPNFLPIFGLTGIGSYPVVLNDGSLGVAYDSSGAAPVAVPGDQPDIALGGGVLWALAPGAGAEVWPAPLTFTQTAITVASSMANGQRYQRSSGGLLAATVDSSDGRIYIAWDDKRFRTADATSINDIVVTSSTTDGLTWGPVTRVDSEAPTDDYVDRYNAMVAAADGVLHVGYLQRQEDSDAAGDGSTFSRYIDTMYQQSRDGGLTFTAPLKVNTTLNDFYYGAFSRSGLFQGDYSQIAVSGPLVYITRDQSHPLYAGEPAGLHYVGGSEPYVGDGGSCEKVVPACLTHLHQRTWVAVLGEATAPVPTPQSQPQPQRLSGPRCGDPQHLDRRPAGDIGPGAARGPGRPAAGGATAQAQPSHPRHDLEQVFPVSVAELRDHALDVLGLGPGHDQERVGGVDHHQAIDAYHRHQPPAVAVLGVDDVLATVQQQGVTADGVAVGVGLHHVAQVGPAAHVAPGEVGGHHQQVVGALHDGVVDSHLRKAKVGAGVGFLVALGASPCGGPGALGDLGCVPGHLREERAVAPGEDADVPEVVAGLHHPLGLLARRLLDKAERPPGIGAALGEERVADMDVAEAG